ncbi:MAG: hypothetical protein LBE15_00275, partial [Burkholderiales bacterium]|nr:hypothetical protein [Burkholderiales bacterium]
MKRHLFHILSGAVLALGFSLSASVLAQETIVYPDNFPPQALQTVNGAAYSLAPTGSSNGKSASLSGNSITVRSGGLALGSVYGAINLINSEMVTNNQVFINGHVQSSVYAGYHRNLDENVAEEGNTTVADN